MKTILVKANAIFLVFLTGFISPHSFAYGQKSVFIESSTIKLSFRSQTGLYEVTGIVQNSLPVEVRDVMIRLYKPSPKATGARVWQIKLEQIKPLGTRLFVMGIAPEHFSKRDAFTVSVWQFDLKAKIVEDAMRLTAEPDPQVLGAVVRALEQFVGPKSINIEGHFVRASIWGRMCLVEASLASGNPFAMQYLAEELLRDHKIINIDSLENVRILSKTASLPSPFPLITKWNPSGNPHADLIDLVKAFPVKSLPMLVRMYNIGTYDSHEFADENFRILNMDTFDKQLKSYKLRGRVAVFTIYREQARLFPSDIRLRHTLGLAELNLNFFFILSTIAISLISPYLAVRQKRHLL